MSFEAVKAEEGAGAHLLRAPRAGTAAATLPAGYWPAACVAPAPRGAYHLLPPSSLTVRGRAQCAAAAPLEAPAERAMEAAMLRLIEARARKYEADKAVRACFDHCFLSLQAFFSFYFVRLCVRFWLLVCKHEADKAVRGRPPFSFLLLV